MSKLNKDQMEALEHLSGYLNALGANTQQYLKVFDPSESKEVYDYVLKVARAVDQLVLVVTHREDDEEARAKLDESNITLIDNLTKLHNSNRSVH